MRRDAAAYNWDSLENNDIDTYAKHITEKILKQFIRSTINSNVEILNDNGNLMTSDTEKANLLTFFSKCNPDLMIRINLSLTLI
jgi:hypothetical protein